MCRKFFLFMVLGLCCSTWANAQKEWAVLASPIQLQSAKTIVDIHDYFPYAKKIDSVQSKGYISKLDSNILTIENIIDKKTNSEKRVGYIRFFIGNEYYDIPVLPSKKQQVIIPITLAQAVSKLEIKGTFSNWNAQSENIKASTSLPCSVWNIELQNVTKGKHEFKLIADGKEVDPLNMKTVSNGMGGTNTLLMVGQLDTRKAKLISHSFQGANIELKAEDIEGYIAFWQHHQIASVEKSTTKFNVQIPDEAKKIQRSFVRVYAYNSNGISNDILVPLEYGRVLNSTGFLNREDAHTQIMYFMMVDRFFNGDKNNDPAPLADVLPKANFMGGDIAGLEQKLKDGYFEDLGCNTLWLSPIAKNPTGAWGLWTKGVNTKFSAYHGYWPTSYSLVDPRFGTNKSFTQLIETAHTKEMNVVLDFVAHHIHTDHPLYKQHPDWVTSLYLPDGSMNTERWDDYRLTTWFDTFLPTLDFQRPIVNSVISDSVMYWVRNFDIDGFRHDASKHVPEVFWKTLTYKIRQEQLAKNKFSFYQIGETYGSPELIGSYVNSGQMDAQFDFNLYDASLNAFALNTANAEESKKSFNRLQENLETSLSYYGSHHLMGNISGNQDKPRFMSIADGSVSLSEDTKLAGWTRNIEVKDTMGYHKLAQMMAFNFTVPGIPIIYYGDEIGLPGANDPDNRRMMKFTNLNTSEQELKETVQKLCNLRKSNLELVYGEWNPVPCNEGFYAYERNYFGKNSLIIFSKQAGDITFSVNDKRALRSNFNHEIKRTKNIINITLNANDFEILQYE